MKYIVQIEIAPDTGVDIPNEDALFEALHASWVFLRTYPEVSPVVDG